MLTRVSDRRQRRAGPSPGGTRRRHQQQQRGDGAAPQREAEKSSVCAVLRRRSELVTGKRCRDGFRLFEVAAVLTLGTLHHRSCEVRMGGGGTASAIRPGSPSHGRCRGTLRCGPWGTFCPRRALFLHCPSESVRLFQFGKSWKVGKKHFRSNKKFTLVVDEEKGQNQTENCAFVSLKVFGFDKFTTFHF